MKTTKTIMYKYKAIYNVRYAEMESTEDMTNRTGCGADEL